MKPRFLKSHDKCRSYGFESRFKTRLHCTYPAELTSTHKKIIYVLINSYLTEQNLWHDTKNRRGDLILPNVGCSELVERRVGSLWLDWQVTTLIQEICIIANSNSHSVLLDACLRHVSYLLVYVFLWRERTMITLGNSFCLSRVVAPANVYLCFSTFMMFTHWYL